MNESSSSFSQNSDILTPDTLSRSSQDGRKRNKGHQGFYPGMITRIKLRNFLTFSKMEIKPLPKLNVIQGPNGTGKSTFLCAVVIGLGGKPEIIGRSSHLDDYIKRDCSKTTTEIELYGGSKNYIIKREISAKKSSVWYLQGEEVDYKSIEDILKKLNINVNNLCQILPQDRVQDFAKMNKAQLLDATQKAVGDTQMYEWFVELKSARKNNQDQEKKLKDIIKEKDDAEALLAHMEPDVEVFRKKHAEQKDLSNMKKKMDWILFADKKKEWVQINENLKQLTNSFEADRKELKTAMDDYKKGKQTEGTLNAKVQNLKGKLNKVKLKSRETKRKLLQAKEKALHAEREYNEKLTTERERGNQINEIKQRIEEAKKAIGDKNEEAETEAIKDLVALLETLSAKLSALRPKQLHFEEKRSSLNQEINHYKRILDKCLNVKQKKLGILSEMHDANKAYEWLEQNRDKFSRPIYGPLFLDVNVTDTNKAACVEKSINYRDLTAFVCEDASDMTKFSKMIRQQGPNLKINIVHSAPPDISTKAFYRPNVPLDSLRQFGFTNYLIDLVEAPEPILKYLCKSYNFHNIPTGSSEVTNHIDHIPRSIRSFFSDEQIYRTKQSRFSGDRITSISQLTSAHLLASSVNHELINSTQNKLNQLQNSMGILDENVGNILEEKKVIEVEINKTRNEKLGHSKILEFVKSNKRRVKVFEEDLKEILSTTFNREEEERKLKKIKEKSYIEIIDLSRVAAEDLNLDNLASHKLAIVQLKADIISSSMVQKEQTCTKLQAQCREAKRTLEDFKVNCDSLKAEIKNLLEIAKKGTDGMDICDPEFNRRYPRFATLPDNQVELQQLIIEKETGMRFYKKSLKEDILQIYKQQQELVAKLQKDFEHLQNKVQNKHTEIKTLKDKWMSRISPLVESIDKIFGKSLCFLKCSGEVMLDPGLDPDAFENYGLVIKVKFRNECELQALDPFTQSGGERALTTAVFLLSLQNVIKVPFRMADEINQGMDAFNEYRVNFLLMCAVSQDKKSQYFLITPKHFGAIKMTEDVTTFTISSGELATNIDLEVSIDEEYEEDEDEDDDDENTAFSFDDYFAKMNVRPL